MNQWHDQQLHSQMMRQAAEGNAQSALFGLDRNLRVERFEKPYVRADFFARLRNAWAAFWTEMRA